MEMIKIRHTDLEVSRLAMGCMGLGGGWGSGTQLTTDHERQAREFLDAAEEIGANFFDHANIYGRGRSEEVFGRVLKESPSFRDKIVIQSKCGIRWADDPPGTPLRYDFSREHILESVDAILGRLGTDRLDARKRGFGLLSITILKCYDVVCVQLAEFLVFVPCAGF